MHTIAVKRMLLTILAALALAGLAALSLPATADAGASTTPLTPTVIGPPARR